MLLLAWMPGMPSSLPPEPTALGPVSAPAGDTCSCLWADPALLPHPKEGLGGWPSIPGPPGAELVNKIKSQTPVRQSWAALSELEGPTAAGSWKTKEARWEPQDALFPSLSTPGWALQVSRASPCPTPETWSAEALQWQLQYCSPTSCDYMQAPAVPKAS